jgi:hypothetical protein
MAQVAKKLTPVTLCRRCQRITGIKKSRDTVPLNGQCHGMKIFLKVKTFWAWNYCTSQAADTIASIYNSWYKDK